MRIHLFDGVVGADVQGVDVAPGGVEGLLAGHRPRAPPHRHRTPQLQLHLDEARVRAIQILQGGGMEGRVEGRGGGESRERERERSSFHSYRFHMTGIMGQKTTTKA